MATNLQAGPSRPVIGGGRWIGSCGTVARVVFGSALLAPVAWAELRAGSRLGLLVGIVGFPAAMVAWQWLRARRQPAPLEATGPLATAINCVAGLVIYGTGLVVPALWFTSDALLAFYGMSMLVAAVFGSADCEILAVSNLVLGRHDQVGCLVLSPIDALERRLRGQAA